VRRGKIILIPFPGGARYLDAVRPRGAGTRTVRARCPRGQDWGVSAWARGGARHAV